MDVSENSARASDAMQDSVGASPVAGSSAASPQAHRRSPGAYVFSDRFIPSRSGSNWAGAAAALMDARAEFFPSPPHASPAAASTEREDAAATYSMLLRAELLGTAGGSGSGQAERPLRRSLGGDLLAAAPSASPGSGQARSPNLLRYLSGGDAGGTAGPATGSPFAASPLGLGDVGAALAPGASPRRAPRKIPRTPFKVLDAPALQDDFYLNLVDWSGANVLAVGLGNCVYLWSACTSRVTKLLELGAGDSVCSVAWTLRGSVLAVGTSSGEVQLWDAAKVRKMRSMAGHKSRAGTLAWSSSALCSGSRDKHILQRDARSPEDFVARLAGHRSEVCGLRWSPDERQLASGGNDNQLLVWSPGLGTGVAGGGGLHGGGHREEDPVLRFVEHKAAVKAIAWSPHQHGLLASGGGTADRCVRFWNTATGSLLSSVDTGSQVCNLAWSKNVNEVVSTHGYSQNQICVWRYPTMAKLATLTGHTLRVLYLAVSPDGQTIVTGAGDETLRFWSVFPGPRSASAGLDSGLQSPSRSVLR